MDKSIRYWHIAGVLFIIISGTFLHFVYEWTGRWMPLALVAAVNESTWEHCKLAFWPAVIFSVIEYFCIKKKVNNFFPARFTAILLMPLFITGIFYGYTFILGHHYLAIDIGLFVFAVMAGEAASYNIMKQKQLKSAYTYIAVIGLAVLITLFSLCTYFPPRLFIFEEVKSGKYGIPPD